MLNFSVQNLDATVKTVIQDSDAAKDLVRQNGQQALYVGLFGLSPHTYIPHPLPLPKGFD